MPELKRCPFCGDIGNTICVANVFYVKCVNCGAHGPGNRVKFLAEQCWNNRAEPPPRKQSEPKDVKPEPKAQ